MTVKKVSVSKSKNARKPLPPTEVQLLKSKVRKLQTEIRTLKLECARLNGQLRQYEADQEESRVTAAEASLDTTEEVQTPETT